MRDDQKILNLNDLAELFGGTAEEVGMYCSDILNDFDKRYQEISGDELETLLLGILKKIHSPALSVAGEQRQEDWNRGWAENLAEFKSSGFDLKTLAPKYLKKNVPVRLFQKYIKPEEPDFTLKMTELFHAWLFQKYLQDAEHVYEFGCGTGFHLAYLAQHFPDKKLYGFDWAQPSVDLLSCMRKQLGWQIEGKRFDFFKPDQSVSFGQKSVVYTFGALEQVGDRFDKYLDFILRAKPQLCIDVAGFDDLYQLDNLNDYLAWLYHKKRNYLDCYVTHLRELEKNKKIEILKIHRQSFGNLYDDPHSYVVWKPL